MSVKCGIVGYTKRAFKGIDPLAQRICEVIPDCVRISADDPESDFYIKNYEKIVDELEAVFFIEYHFDIELVKKLFQAKKKIILIPMWEHILAAKRMWPYITDFLFLNRRAEMVVRKVLSKKGVLAHYPLYNDKPKFGSDMPKKFFMINGMPAKNRKKPHLLSWMNSDKKFDITVYTVGDIPGGLPNVKVKKGFIESKEELFRGAGDMQIYPSTLEGLGMAIYESMEYGIPTICANVAPINEQYHPRLLFKPNNHDSIRKTVEKYHKEGLKEIKDWMAEYIEKNSPDVFVSKVSSML